MSHGGGIPMGRPMIGTRGFGSVHSRPFINGGFVRGGSPFINGGFVRGGFVRRGFVHGGNFVHGNVFVHGRGLSDQCTSFTPTTRSILV